MSRRTLLGLLTAGSLIVGMVPVWAHHKPSHPIPPGHQTTTTTAQTSTTTAPTTTTTAASSTTSTQATTTSTSGTTQVINLSADWMIHGHDARSNFKVNGNGHAIMVMGGTVDWDEFEIDNVDRVMFMDCAGPSRLEDGLITNSGTAGVVGAYPLHWHLNGDCTRGTTVTRVTVTGGRNHAFVPHGSHGITFKDTIAKDTLLGDAYWWDSPGTNDDADNDDGDSVDSSDDIVYDHTLAIGGMTDGHRGGAYKLGAGDGNIIRDSAALDTQGGSSCAGFVWPEGSQGVWVFENNFASSADCHGIFVWQNDQRIHPVDGFSGDGVDHGAYNNDYIYSNLDVPYFNIHASGWRMEDSTVDRLVAFRHRALVTTTFINVTVGEFIVNNGQNSGEVPGRYVFVGGNLTCGGITYQDVVPGTTVTINGQEC